MIGALRTSPIRAIGRLTFLQLLSALLILFALVSSGNALAQALRAEAPEMRAPPDDTEDKFVNGANMVSQDVPTSMVTGKLYNVSVVMRNGGGTVWQRGYGYKLASVAPDLNTTWGPNRVDVAADVVNPLATTQFNFQVRAPTTPGTYTFQWRMLQENVEWFGAATTAVTITVRAPTNDAQSPGQSVPAQMTTGQPYNVSVTMKNTGETTWAAGTYMLAHRDWDHQWVWGVTAAALPVSVAPGEQYTFPFTVWAPAAAGNYTFQWEMLQDGVEWFGAVTSNAVSVKAPVNAAQVVGTSVPPSMVSGSTYGVTVTMKNTGTTTWAPGTYKLAHRDWDHQWMWGVAAATLPVSVAPGEQYTFSFSVSASAAGSYTFQWEMLQEGVEWFGAVTSNTVGVTAPVNAAQVVSTSVPPHMVTGVGYDVAVTMKNTGATTWAPGAYKLGQRDWDNEWMWGIQSVALPASVAPGQQYTFQFKVWGPSPGSHTFQWAMVNVGNEWFGAITNNAVTVTDNLGNVTFIHTDGLGSPVARTDAAGKVISTTRYEPYGYVAGGATPTVGFTGHVNDADTGLTYMQQRYYDPVAGRFLSIDPVVTDANTGGSFNRYVYANNSPYKYIDPDGRDSTVKDGVIKIEPKDPTVPRITLPNTVGATGISSSSITFHTYDVKMSSNLTNAAAVGNGIANSPTPGLGNLPASPAGTVNNAGGIPTAGNTNIVKSFAVNTPDANKFTNITVNYTVSGGHGLAEGFVIRYGEISPSNGTITLRSYGEGNNWRQAEALKGIWGPQVERVWGNNQQSIINGIQ